MTLVAEPTLGPTTLPHFLVKQLHPKKHGLNEAELVTAVQEIELQTQIAGASFIKVHVADPDWTITTSGLIAVSEDGLLNELEVEFPEKTGFWWRLCAVEGSTEVNANLVLTFEDRTVARLRQQWGHKTAGSGTSTRAQFVKALVGEANLKGHLSPPIRFVSPGVNRKEPVAESAEEKKEKQVQTPAAKQKSEAEENKTGGIHAGATLTVAGSAMTPAQRQTANELLGVCSEQNAGPVATEAMIYAAIGETRLGASSSTSSAGAKGVLQSLNAPFDTPSQAKNFLNGNGDFQKGGAKKLSQTVSNPKQVAIEVEVPSIWPKNSYEEQEGGTKFLAEAQAIVHAGGGVTAGGTSTHSNESGVGQLSRGTTTNPDEDSWDCIQRLAQEVNWHAFTDGRNGLFYMDGPDLIKQRPVLYVNPAHKLPTGDVTSHVVREDKGGQKVEQYGVLVRPLSFNYDNVAFTYRATHKVKGKLQRKSKIAKPQSPSEIRMNMLCGLTEYRAGTVFVFQHCGPISENGGRWIVADATRECMKYPYTKFLLVPATEPLPEPQASENPSTSNSPIAGATNPAPGATWGRLDMGFDGNYGEAGPVAPYDGTVHVPGISGWPGEGIYFYIVNDNQNGPDYTRAMYFAEGATPIVSDGARVKAGTPLGKRVFHGGTGALGNFEIGPAQTGNGDCLAKTYGLSSPGAKKMVLAFAAWLQTLGAGAPTDSSAAGGP